MDLQEAIGEKIEVPGAPQIPGLTFRHFGGPNDFTRMAAAANASYAADGVDRLSRAEDLERFYAHLVNCDVRRDMLLVEVDGELVSYNRAYWQREEPGPWVYGAIGVLRPEWRGRGLEQPILAYLEAHLREIAAGHASAGERFFQAEAGDTETAREALLLGTGYVVVRQEQMMAQPLGAPVAVSPMPEGLEVRPVGPERYRDVWEADAEAFRDHWGFVPPTEDDYRGWLDSTHFNPAIWKVAFDTATNEVAGMVLNFVNEAENIEYKRRRGYTEGISVRRPWRKRGLARALLTRSLQMFTEMGMTEAALGVDTQNLNSAYRLYESVGFRMTKRYSIYRKAF